MSDPPPIPEPLWQRVPPEAQAAVRERIERLGPGEPRASVRSTTHPGEIFAAPCTSGRLSLSTRERLPPRNRTLRRWPSERTPRTSDPEQHAVTRVPRIPHQREHGDGREHRR